MRRAGIIAAGAIGATVIPGSACAARRGPFGDYAKAGVRTYAMRFRGVVAELPAGPVTLFRLCGTPLISFAVVPAAPRRWRLEIESPLDAPARRGRETAERELLQELADRRSVTLRCMPGTGRPCTR